MASRASPRTPPLPTALSQALIAFTIEFDNEFEHRIEHHTGNKAGRGVWLTSMVMWSNFMRLIPSGGVALEAVKANGRITNLDGLQRWGYINVEPADQTVHLKPGGRRAQKCGGRSPAKSSSGGASGSATPRSTNFARRCRASPTPRCRCTCRCSDTPMACAPGTSAPHPARWPRISPRCSRRHSSPSPSSTRTSPNSRLR